MKLQVLLVILEVMLGDIGHFRGQPRGVGSQGWRLDVPASQASRRGSVSEPGARGREGGQFVGWKVAVGQLESLARVGWGKVSGLQVLRRGAAVCNQLPGFEYAIFPP